MPWKPPSINDRTRYGAAWQRQRAATLRAEPLCRLCLAAGMTVPATIVDHILPIADGGGNEQSNLQPLCKRCHDAIKTPSDKASRACAEQFDASIVCVSLDCSLSYGLDARAIRRMLAPSCGWDAAHRASLAACDGVLIAGQSGGLPRMGLQVVSDDVRWCRLASERHGFRLQVDAVGSQPRGCAEAEWVASRWSSESALRDLSRTTGTQAERANQ